MFYGIVIGKNDITIERTRSEAGSSSDRMSKNGLDQKEPPDDFYYLEFFPILEDTGSIYHLMLR